MAGLEIFFPTKTKAKVLLVELDASIEESHVGRVEKSTHPVEAGSDITDHLRRLPDKLTIRGVITNTPISFLASITSRSPVTGDVGFAQDRVDLGYRELLRAKDAGDIGTVVTSLREYKNMAITSLSVSRNANSGNILDISIELEEVLISTTETIEAPPEPKKKTRKGVKKQGNQASRRASTAVEAKGESFSVTLGNAFTGAT